MALAAVISGIYYGVCFAVSSPSLSARLTKLAVYILVTVTAFGTKRGFVLKCGVFLVLKMALEGSFCGYSAAYPLPALFFAGTMVTFCGMLRKKTKSRKYFSEITIRYNGKTIRINALRDTGNMLSDPITGEGIVILSPKAATDLTGLSQQELANPVETLGNAPISGLRLISYSTVGNAGGLMLALRFHHTVVDGIKGSILAGMAAEGMDGYDALIGGDYD